jgi:hypothetical protein
MLRVHEIGFVALKSWEGAEEMFKICAAYLIALVVAIMLTELIVMLR